VKDEVMSMSRMPSSAAAATDADHDTVGLIALDIHANVASGTSTNGARFRIPGFVVAALLLFQTDFTDICTCFLLSVFFSFWLSLFRSFLVFLI